MRNCVTQFFKSSKDGGSGHTEKEKNKQDLISSSSCLYPPSFFLSHTSSCLSLPASVSAKLTSESFVILSQPFECLQYIAYLNK